MVSEITFEGFSGNKAVSHKEKVFQKALQQVKSIIDDRKNGLKQLIEKNQAFYEKHKCPYFMALLLYRPLNVLNQV